MNVGSLFNLYAISIFPHVDIILEPNREPAENTVKAVKCILVVPVVLSTLAGIGCAIAAVTPNQSLNFLIAKRLTLAFGSIATAIFVLGFCRFYHQMTR